MSKSQKHRALVAAAFAAATMALASQPAAAQDAFVNYYLGGAAIGGFSPSGSNTFYQANFSPNAGFTRWDYSGSWSSTLLVGSTDMQTFSQSQSVAGSGSLPLLASGGLPLIGDIVLNPASLTISRVDVASPITYMPGTIGFVIDSPGNVLEGSTVRYDLQKIGYFYDLRQVGAAAGGGVDRNGNGDADWNDVFEPLFSRADMRTVAGYSGTSPGNSGRHFAYSSDGQSVYFVDSSNTSVVGGLWKKTLTASGTTGLTRILTGTTSFNTEPSVVPTSVRDFGGGAGAGDQVVVIGSTFSFNSNPGGLSYVVDTGSGVSTPRTLLTAKQIQVFLETSGTPTALSTGADADGNVYVYNSTDDGVFKYDAAKRLSKAFSRAEQIAFETTTAGGTSSTASVLDMKFRDVSYTGPSGAYTVGQLLYSSAGSVRAPIGVHLFEPGDFDRDNDVDAADIAALKYVLNGQEPFDPGHAPLAGGVKGLRGTAIASVGSSSPFTQVNPVAFRFDLNGSVVSGTNNVVFVDWKDVKIFQQYAGLSAGDVDMDFDVDATDLATIGAHYGSTGKIFTEGNISSVRLSAPDRDDVNFADLLTLASSWTGAKPALSPVGSIPQADIDRAFAITANGTISEYIAPASGAWSAASNWSAGGVPNAPGAVASLLTAPQDDVNLDVDGNYTVGQLNFDNFFTYTLGGAGTLHLDGNGTIAEINAFGASPTISAGVWMDTATAVNVTYAIDTLTVSGAVNGSGSLSKTGAGRLLLTGTNSFSGNVTVNGGTLQASKTGAFPGFGTSGRYVADPGATLAVNAGGAGEWTVANIDTFRGAATFSAGSALGIDTTNITAGFTYPSNIGGVLGITKLGANRLTLSGTNSYSGVTTINAGTLAVSNSGNLGNASGTNIVAFNGGTLLALAAFNNARNVSMLPGGGTIDTGAFNLTFSGVVSGSGNLAKAGTGTLVLSNSNINSGAMNLNAGVMSVGASAALGDASATNVLVFGGGTLLTTANLTNARNVTLATGGGTVNTDVNTVTFGGVVSGSAALNKTGAGTLVLTATNTNSSTVNINGGILSVAAAENLGSSTTSTALTFNGGTLRTTGSFFTLRNVTLNAGGGTVNTEGNTLTFSGVVSGTGSLTKSGAGMLVLPAINTFTGATNINAGTVKVASVTALQSSTVNINIANGLNLDGYNAILGGLAGSGALDLTGTPSIGNNNANTTYAGTLSGAGGITKIGSGTTTLTGTLNHTGPTAVSAGKLLLQTNLTPTSAISVIGGTLELLAGGTRHISTPSVSASGTGQVDLRDNKLIVTGQSLGTWSGSDYDGVTGLIRSARNGGAWNGAGISTSMTDASAASSITTLGVATADDVDKDIFGGVSVLGSDVLVMYTYAGDADLTGSIDGDDFARIDAGYSSQLTGYANGDFNYSGGIDADDYWLIDRGYSKNLPRSGRECRRACKLCRSPEARRWWG